MLLGRQHIHTYLLTHMHVYTHTLSLSLSPRRTGLCVDCGRGCGCGCAVWRPSCTLIVTAKMARPLATPTYLSVALEGQELIRDLRDDQWGDLFGSRLKPNYPPPPQTLANATSTSVGNGQHHVAHSRPGCYPEAPVRAGVRRPFHAAGDSLARGPRSSTTDNVRLETKLAAWGLAG